VLNRTGARVFFVNLAAFVATQARRIFCGSTPGSPPALSSRVLRKARRIEIRYTQAELDECMAEIRDHVCIRCIEKLPGAPPCAPQGKRCGIELHLADVIEVCHAARGKMMDPYITRFHEDVCSHCANRTTMQCPCPLDYLLLLAVEAVEAVDERKTRYNS